MHESVEPMKGNAMKILVAGATGALGKQLVPRLVAAGHAVVGMTRSESKRDALRAMGATPVVADALDPDQVARADLNGNRRSISSPPAGGSSRST